jgi:hypothetical protein
VANIKVHHKIIKSTTSLSLKRLWSAVFLSHFLMGFRTRLAGFRAILAMSVGLPGDQCKQVTQHFRDLSADLAGK